MRTFEVEIKYRITDITKLELQLRHWGGSGFGGEVTDCDTFFQHPCRDFVQTDECLRLRNRILSDGSSEHSLTYKGPKIDALTKTRQEIEIPIAEPHHWESLLNALGFCKSASLHKFRRRLTLTLNHRQIDFVFDTLPALPESSRLFLEMETLATEENLEECRTLLLDIAGQLGLSEPIQESYLNLVIGHLFFQQ